MAKRALVSALLILISFHKCSAQPADIPPAALLYHSDPDVRIQTIKTLAESQRPDLVDDLVRAHCVENYTPVHHAYRAALQSISGRRDIRLKGAWKAWLAAVAWLWVLSVDERQALKRFLPLSLRSTTVGS